MNDMEEFHKTMSWLGPLLIAAAVIAGIAVLFFLPC